MCAALSYKYLYIFRLFFVAANVFVRLRCYQCFTFISSRYKMISILVIFFIAVFSYINEKLTQTQRISGNFQKTIFSIPIFTHFRFSLLTWEDRTLARKHLGVASLVKYLFWLRGWLMQIWFTRDKFNWRLTPGNLSRPC